MRICLSLVHSYALLWSFLYITHVLPLLSVSKIFSYLFLSLCMFGCLSLLLVNQILYPSIFRLTPNPLASIFSLFPIVGNLGKCFFKIQDFNWFSIHQVYHLAFIQLPYTSTGNSEKFVRQDFHLANPSLLLFITLYSARCSVIISFLIILSQKAH